VGDALGDILSLVDLGDLLGQELVTPLADVQDLCTLDTPSCMLSMLISSTMKQINLT
jgi:hypothetical protein